MAKNKSEAKKSIKPNTAKKKSLQTSYKSPEVKDEDLIVIEPQYLLTPIAIILGALLISGAIMFSFYKWGGDTVSSNGDANSGTNTAVDLGNGGDTPSADPTTATVSIDDDAILGNKDKAKIAIVEFSDYECPFCQRHWAEVHPTLVKKYIDTGDAIMVYRDFPLPSLHDYAMPAALASECVHDLGGDTAFYKYHDLLFGKGFSSVSDIVNLAGDLGFDKAKVQKCIDDNTYADEIDADTQDALAVGIQSTPSFVIGTLNDDGTVDGTVVIGAQPLSVFESTIESYLK